MTKFLKIFPHNKWLFFYTVYRQSLPVRHFCGHINLNIKQVFQVSLDSKIN